MTIEHDYRPILIDAELGVYACADCSAPESAHQRVSARAIECTCPIEPRGATLCGHLPSCPKGKELAAAEEGRRNPFVMLPVANEIVEKNIRRIELAASSTFNRDYLPDRHEAKWFRDELGQLWVKFYIDGKCHVAPADRVVMVEYHKKA